MSVKQVKLEVQEPENLAFPERIEAYIWAKLKKDDDMVCQIVGITPAGADSNHPYNRYTIEFFGGEKIVLKESVMNMLFAYTGIAGQVKEDYNQAVKRIGG